MRHFPLLLAALPLAVSVHAQTNETNERTFLLEEIIVTAAKRETALQDTAIAVTALTANLMEQMDITSPFDYEALVPSLTYQQSPNRLSIRGVGRFSNSLGVYPGVAFLETLVEVDHEQAGRRIRHLPQRHDQCLRPGDG